MRLGNLRLGDLRLNHPHLRSRARIVAGVAALALGAAWAGRQLPERSEASVSEILGRGAGGVVAPTDYVWERSWGPTDDLFAGRGVVFLAKAERDGPSDVWRGRVSVTPSGRPLFGRTFHKLSDTEWGDERALVVAHGRAAFATWFAGKAQSISVANLSETDEAVTHHVLREPAERAVFELAGSDDLLVAVGQPAAAARVAIGKFAVDAEPSAELGIVHRTLAPPLTESLEAFVVTRADGPASDEAPEGFAALVAPSFEGGEPPILERVDSGSRVWIVDTRQLDAALLPGRVRPHSDTGWEDVGGLLERIAAERTVAAVGLPMSRSVGRSGFVSGGHWLGLMAERAPSFGVQAGAVRLGPWPFEPWSAPPVVAQWLGPDGERGRFAICVTRTGRISIGWSDADMAPPPVSVSMPSSCEITASGNAGTPFVGIGPDAIEQWQSTGAGDDPLLVLLRKADTLPRIRLPAGAAWRTPADIQSAPAWIPSAVEGTLTVLGVEVTVTHFDARRYAWALMLGEREKSHRLKGHFPEGLPPDQASRALFAIGLGTGKRRNPRGLRIGGSTGHPFAGKEGLLVVGPSGLSLLGPERVAAEPEADGTELPLTAFGGALLAGARERGPRQVRADLCVLDGGDVLLAEAVFDSHEPSATALVKLGCLGAAALDRGAELPVFRETGASASVPHEVTALVALARPLLGSASGWDSVAPR